MSCAGKVSRAGRSRPCHKVMRRSVNALGKPNWANKACAVFVLGTTIAAAQTFTTLASFNFADGAGPFAGLTQGLDGNFYGTTYSGGAYNYVTIFKVKPGGDITTLFSFDSIDGANPNARLVLAPSGAFYGTTFQGGNTTCGGGFGCGTVFEYYPGGALYTLHNFDSSDGANPAAGLVQAIDHNFYGTTSQGGNFTNCPIGCGTIFRITPGSGLTTVHRFNGTDGAGPNSTLVQATDGSLYGTTSIAFSGGYGTVFKFTLGGTLTTLHAFDIAGGQDPGALLQSADGNLYGTTAAGGAAGCGGPGCGTFFKITLAGALTTLHSFDMTHGYDPLAPLLQANNGDFYGTTRDGGPSANCVDGCGTIFKITPAGKLTTLYAFSGVPDGQWPIAGLIQGTDGNLYGTTSNGGATGDGSVFRLSVGLGPFVKPVPPAGSVGSTVKILGTNLTGATTVSFNGTQAIFTVISPSEIVTTVPSGATTGKVHVRKPHGTLSSGGPFIVTP